MSGRHSPPTDVGVATGEFRERQNGAQSSIFQPPPQAEAPLPPMPPLSDPSEPSHTPVPTPPSNGTSATSTATTLAHASNNGLSSLTPDLTVPDIEPLYSDGERELAPKQGIIVQDGVEFHHASEAEFARLLTYYGIEWQYEPQQFPLQWREGRPIEMFSPDFYLTEYDLYIELTTMRQALVRRKNRKLRFLRALYPEINIKLLYRRDYQRLLERFGIPPEEFEAD